MRPVVDAAFTVGLLMLSLGGGIALVRDWRGVRTALERRQTDRSPERSVFPPKRGGAFPGRTWTATGWVFIAIGILLLGVILLDMALGITTPLG
jgi:hypothetical protein